MKRERFKSFHTEIVGNGLSDGLPSRVERAGLPAGEEASIDRAEISRRSVMKLMAASAVLALGMPGCRRKPFRKIVSMAESPEYQHPGTPLYYASTWTEGSLPYGMKIKTLDGRPVKIEGLSDHPLNRGSSSAPMQASILSLYDPDRLRAPMRKGRPITWSEADREIAHALKKARKAVLITRSLLGPSERSLVDDFLDACPTARHFVHETVHDGPRRSAWKKIYCIDGAVEPLLSRAKIILTIDSDFLGTDGDTLKGIQDFARGRVTGQGAPRSSRLYAAESAMTLTGANADHRLPIRPSAAHGLVQALRAALNGEFGGLHKTAQEHGLDEKVLIALAKDLKSHSAESVVLAGPHLPEEVHAAVCLLNEAIDAPGSTLEWNPSPPTLPVDDPAEIAAALEEGVDLLLLMGVNPVYDWPGGGFEALLGKARVSVGHGLYLDETLSACTFSLPSSHNLESWNDALPLPGLHSLCQPVIAPLFDSRQEAESLLAWTRSIVPSRSGGNEPKDWHDYIRSRWQSSVLSHARERAWEDALRKGLSGSRVDQPMPVMNKNAARAMAGREPPPPGAYELVILPHHALFDGRFANNGWLQELPDPVSKLVWDNAAMIGPGLAKKLKINEGDDIEVRTKEKSLVLPVLVQPGVAGGVVAVTLGHGRTRAGVVGDRRGFNTAVLMQKGAPTRRLAFDVKLSPSGTEHRLVRTQKAFSMEGRAIVVHGTLQEYARDPGFVKKRIHLPKKAQLHDAFDYSQNPKWVMAVDLNACVGCGACVTACQAENNIPVVGKEECALGREMHWIRIDQYHEGDPKNPRIHHQPMLCQHCDNAPCESVCPVNATAHSAEGLNEQVYNRCVGTRYCANNCPYKVRRFNFFNYTKRSLNDPVQELAYNPQVTVRSRGVMEKCTFCVQRINEEKFKSKNEERALPDGAVLTACQQACPAGAIVFGDLNDPKSRISRMKASPLAYHVLEELNVRPNVSYLARILNPHTETARSDKGGKG